MLLYLGMSEDAPSSTSDMSPESQKFYHSVDGITFPEQNTVDNAVSRVLAAEPYGVLERGIGGGFGGARDGEVEPFGQRKSTDEELRLRPRETQVRAERPWQITTAVRNRLEIWERKPTTFTPTYANQELEHLLEKAQYYRNIRGMTPEEAEENGYYFPELLPETERKLRELAFANLAEEFEARITLLQQVELKKSISADIRTYQSGFFTASQRPKMEMWMYKAIFESGPTREGRDPFGKIVNDVMRHYMLAAEGGLVDWKRDAIQNIPKGDESAVVLAEMLLKNWDVHVNYSAHGGKLSKHIKELMILLGRKNLNINSPDTEFLTEEYVRNCNQRKDSSIPISLDTGTDVSNDTAKARFIGLRQISEYLGNGDSLRVNPNAVAPPATIGCFPNLTASALDIISYKDKDTGKEISLMDAWRKGKVDLDEIPWLKIPNFAEQAKYELQKFYAQQVFDSIMVKNMAEAGVSIKDPGYLQNLNKAYETTFGILWGNVDLLPRTKTKLKQLAKVNMLAGIACANTEIPKLNQPGLYGIMGIRLVSENVSEKYINKEAYYNIIVTATELSGFFSKRSDKELYDKEVRLLKNIVMNRRIGCKPSALLGDWFSQDELDAIDKAGLYAPFKC